MLNNLAAIVTVLLSACSAYSQSFKILHYTETSGFDHNTRQVSLSMFQSLGATNDFVVDHDNDGHSFNSVSALEQYAAVVFANTSGDNLLDSAQRANFQSYILNGGSLIGIHAASDTYRHSTANGSNTGSWNWYAEMIGASVQQNPNHVSGTPAYTMHKTGSHFTTQSLPDPWLKNEEFYYWDNGYFNDDNVTVLEVEQTVGPNGQVNPYDSVRPMSWVRELSGGGRIFYTALGHAAGNYTSDTNFINHIRDAVLWAARMTTSVNIREVATNQSGIVCFRDGALYVDPDFHLPAALNIFDLAGRSVKSLFTIYENTSKSCGYLNDLSPGMYVLRLQNNQQVVAQKIYLH